MHRICSDGVLNPSGVRFGSSEIYGALERFSSQIDDTLCVGQRRPQDTDERVLLFVKMRPGYRLTNALEGKMRSAIRTALSKRHEPSYVFEVTEIPVRKCLHFFTSLTECEAHSTRLTTRFVGVVWLGRFGFADA